MIALLVAAALGIPAGGAIDTGLASAAARWGPLPCPLVVKYEDLPGRLAGWAEPASCRITIDDGLDWQLRCTAAKHEAGHIYGEPHSDNPHDVMYWMLLYTPGDCAR